MSKITFYEKYKFCVVRPMARDTQRMQLADPPDPPDLPGPLSSIAARDLLSHGPGVRITVDTPNSFKSLVNLVRIEWY